MTAGAGFLDIVDLVGVPAFTGAIDFERVAVGATTFNGAYRALAARVAKLVVDTVRFSSRGLIRLIDGKAFGVIGDDGADAWAWAVSLRVTRGSIFGSVFFSSLTTALITAFSSRLRTGATAFAYLTG